MTESDLAALAPPVQLPGRSARTWARYTVRLGLLAFLAIVSVVMASTVSDDGVRVPLVDLGELAFVAFGWGTCFSYWRMGRRSRDEYSAGYTTLFGRFKDTWQLDDRNGAVLRRPRDIGER